MGENEKSGAAISKKATSLLADKPVWVYWIVHTVLSGLIFGVFYAVMYVLGLKWWVTTITVIVVGMIWGTIAFSRRDAGTKEKAA